MVETLAAADSRTAIVCSSTDRTATLADREIDRVLHANYGKVLSPVPPNMRIKRRRGPFRWFEQRIYGDRDSFAERDRFELSVPLAEWGKGLISDPFST